MSLISVKTISVYSGVAHESVDTVDVNKDAIVMIKKFITQLRKKLKKMERWLKNL